MNETLIQNWNSVVSKDDTVYFLGDFAFAGTQKIQEILNKLNRGRLILVRGNHDKDVSDKRWLELGIDEVHQRLELVYQARKFLLCHFPYITGQDGEDTRYLHLRPVDMGVTLLHGHSHSMSNFKIKHTPKNTLMYDVGVDANAMYPVSIDTIITNLC
jgi:calcineurin-like phosphoesterase family protein